MTQFMARSARRLLLIKAAREIIKEIELAGLDNLKWAAENGISIVGPYLQGSSAKRKAELKTQLGYLLSLGVTSDMLLDEVAGQRPEIFPIMAGKESYRKGEIQKLERFLLTTD
ncbi:hypothetical protein ES703_31703 [subsurface metagenome]